MPLRASWRLSRWSALSFWESGPLKGLPGALYLVASGKGIRIEGSGSFSGGFNWVELRVRVGGSGGSGVRSMEPMS